MSPPTKPVVEKLLTIRLFCEEFDEGVVALDSREDVDRDHVLSGRVVKIL